MDILERLKLRLTNDGIEPDESILRDCVESAKNAILSRRFPFGSRPTISVPVLDNLGNPVLDGEGNPLTVEQTFVEDAYLDLQFRCAVDIYNKIGAEGEKQHNENGINRVFDGAWISPELLREVVPFAGVPQ